MTRLNGGYITKTEVEIIKNFDVEKYVKMVRMKKPEYIFDSQIEEEESVAAPNDQDESEGEELLE